MSWHYIDSLKLYVLVDCIIYEFHFRIVERMSNICNKRGSRPDKVENPLPGSSVLENSPWETLGYRKTFWNSHFLFLFYCKPNVRPIISDFTMFLFTFFQGHFWFFNFLVVLYLLRVNMLSPWFGETHKEIPFSEQTQLFWKVMLPYIPEYADWGSVLFQFASASWRYHYQVDACIWKYHCQLWL